MVFREPNLSMKQNLAVYSKMSLCGKLGIVPKVRESSFWQMEEASWQLLLAHSYMKEKIIHNA